MSEQARRAAASSVAWSMDAHSGYPVVPGRVGAHFPGGPAARGASDGFARSRVGDRDSRVRSWSGSHPGGGGHSPSWYRRLAVTASGASGAAILVIWVVSKGGIG